MGSFRKVLRCPLTSRWKGQWCLQRLLIFLIAGSCSVTHRKSKFLNWHVSCSYHSVRLVHWIPQAYQPVGSEPVPPRAMKELSLLHGAPCSTDTWNLLKVWSPEASRVCSKSTPAMPHHPVSWLLRCSVVLHCTAEPRQISKPSFGIYCLCNLERATSLYLRFLVSKMGTIVSIL